MAFVVADRVKQLTTTTGTGTLDLSTVPTGFQGFVAGIGNGNTCPYVIEDANGTGWEVGIGTVTDATPDTLARTTILASSNSGSHRNRCRHDDGRRSDVRRGHERVGDGGSHLHAARNG